MVCLTVASPVKVFCPKTGLVLSIRSNDLLTAWGRGLIQFAITFTTETLFRVGMGVWKGVAAD
jgi:hypothetical protein